MIHICFKHLWEAIKCFVTIVYRLHILFFPSTPHYINLVEWTRKEGGRLLGQYLGKVKARDEGVHLICMLKTCGYFKGNSRVPFASCQNTERGKKPTSAYSHASKPNVHDSPGLPLWLIPCIVSSADWRLIGSEEGLCHMYEAYGVDVNACVHPDGSETETAGCELFSSVSCCI